MPQSSPLQSSSVFSFCFALTLTFQRTSPSTTPVPTTTTAKTTQRVELGKWFRHPVQGLIRCDYICTGNEKCIPNDWKCDDEPDCPQQDDEKHCDIRSYPVSCKDIVMDKKWRCDGKIQCKNGEDELGCGKVAVEAPTALERGETREETWRRMATILFVDV